MENSDLLGVLRSDPAKLTDQELMYLDYAAHSAWKDKCAGGSGIPFKPCSLDLLVEIHLIIRRQMENRGIRHLTADQLDARTVLLDQERRAVEVGFYGRVGGERLPDAGELDV